MNREVTRMALAVDRFAKLRVQRAIGGGAFLRQRGIGGTLWGASESEWNHERQTAARYG